MSEKDNISEYPQILREFASYKSAIQGCSLKTVEEYLLDLKMFFRFLIAKRDRISTTSDDFNKISIKCVDLDFVREIGTQDIYEFLYYVGEQRENKNAAKARKLSSIKGFYKYIVGKRHYLEDNPSADIESPKQRKSLPKYLTLDESVSLLEAVKNDTESKTVTRDFAIITLFLNCGMRVSELVGINTTDIDPELRSLRVIGKGSKERIVYLNAACRDSLEEYIRQRASKSRDTRLTTNALFLSSRDQRISVKTVQWMVYKYLKLAGLSAKNFSVHKLRHTAATLMYQSGKVDVRVLKDILGHEQLNTTQIYTHVSNESMESAMDENPLADIKKEQL